MKESVAYINTNVECVQKFENNTKELKLQYIKNLPKFNTFVGVNIDFEKISKAMKILF